MKSSRFTSRIIVVALILVCFGPQAVQAQSPTPSPGSEGPDLEARLVGFPASVGPDDALTVDLEVTNSGNRPARNLEVALTIFQGVTSRSRLNQTFAGTLGNTLAVDTLPVDGTVGAGQTRQIRVAKPLAELGSFRNSTLDRAYPVRVTVRAGTTSSTSVSTHMIFFHEPPEKPLSLALVVPLHSPSIYTEGGRPDLVTNGSLERSIADGRLSRILGALEQFPDLPVTLAPSGLLLSMLHDMADGYPRTTDNGIERVEPQDPRAQAAGATLERIRNLAARPNTRVIATTYSPASLPALNRFGLQDLAATQLAEGQNVLLAEPVGLLRSQPLDGWFLPTHGDLDRATLSQLHRTNFNQLIISARSLRPSEDSFTRALPVRLEGGPGSVTEGLAGVETVALVADRGLERQVEHSGSTGTIEARQRFIAETATIHLETPGLVRGVVVTAPLDWSARGNSAAELLRVLESASWLHPTTPEVIAGELSPPAGEQVRLTSTGALLDDNSDLPSDSYFSKLSDARLAISQFSALAPPPAEIGSLSRRLLIAESTDWWSSRSALARGLSFAEAIPPAVISEMRKVRGPAPQTITLTSRTGVIPLSVGSGLSYPVDVVLTLESDKLRFPDGNRVAIQDLRPPNQTIRVRATTQSSGTFPLRIQLSTPAGVPISDSQLTIRSTAYNVVALSITAAAGVFILGWWMVSWLRRRLSRHAPDPELDRSTGFEPAQETPREPPEDASSAPASQQPLESG